MAAADGSWDLTIFITDMNVEQTIRTRGDLHVAGLMLKLVNVVEVESKDWSDHALWWPDSKTWLVRTRWTLNKYGVTGGSTLWFTPMHKNVCITLPDLQTIDLRLNFSVNVFNNVIALCKKFRIRHPEELSLSRTTSPTSASQRHSVHQTTHAATAAVTADSEMVSLDLKSSGTASADVMLGRSVDNLFDANDPALPQTGYQTASLDSLLTGLSTLSCSPLVPVRDAVSLLTRPHNYVDKAKIDARWLDSSKSLMEQDIQENDRVMLRYKFSAFFDLKPKYDSVRINQIYEQAKWSIITEHVKCTEEEMALFAGLQLHAQLQQHTEEEQMLSTPVSKTLSSENMTTDEDVDAALDDLQMTLAGEEVDTKSTLRNKCPELRGYHLVYQCKKMAVKRYKIRFFTLTDTQLSMFHDAEHLQQPLVSLDIKGCEVSGLAKMTEKKFTIKLTVRDERTTTELWLRLDNPEQYAEWLAAFRLASKRRTMADVSYTSEVRSILDLLRLRQPAGHLDLDKLPCANIDPDNFAAASCVRKVGRRRMTRRILEARCNVQNMTSLDAKMTYIKAWQRLADSGTAYFIVTFKDSKKKELVAVGAERVARLDLTTGQCVQTWSYDMMTSWSVNWTSEQVKVELRGDYGDHEMAFQCLSADCKVVHEFIGGYVFVSMRSLDKNQTLDEELFQKLTGGWH